MKLTKIEDHESELKARLLAQFKDDPNFNKLYEFYSKETQRVEDCLFQIWSYTLDNANGKRLELEGSNHNCPRPLSGLASTDDNVYRALIKATIVIAFSESTMQDIYTLLRYLGATSIQASNIPESGNLKLFVSGNLIIDLDEILKYINQATAPIVIQLIQRDSSTAFKFGVSGHGFGTGKLGKVAK